jgi:hypothetical protein
MANASFAIRMAIGKTQKFAVAVLCCHDWPGCGCSPATVIAITSWYVAIRVKVSSGGACRLYGDTWGEPAEAANMPPTRGLPRTTTEPRHIMIMHRAFQAELSAFLRVYPEVEWLCLDDFRTQPHVE